MSSTSVDYLKIRKEGGSRVLAVTDVIPVHWNIVTLEAEEQEDDLEVTLHVKKIC